MTTLLTCPVDDFAATLLCLPLDMEMISDAVYANSTTMNGQHFAEEFIRRKRLADKGIAEKQPGSDGGKFASSGGWNEVAKKGGHGGAAAAASAGPSAAPKEEPAVGFRVVPGRKKGKK
ncbi:hypothetical protein IMZ48_14905 [Candidatus Bathyarchaeota archaeon]|nr:hypothetical protein [Candidatus Bathyarchaeota archaeon]